MTKRVSNDALEQRLRSTTGESEEDVHLLTARLAERAAEDGLLDVAYATADTPVGPVLVAGTPRGLVRVTFPQERRDDVLDELARNVSPRILESPAQLDDVRRELDEYFEGRRREFDLPLDWRLSHGFRRDALRALVDVPYGETVTYSELATSAGSPRAHRAAGSACGSNPIPIVVPCHRVVRTGGGLGGYGGGLEVKEYLLELEGSLGDVSTG
ncbi:MAG: methylated-DNA--[protein]-cysteine S-methyltransferase [Solirubrobacterales bacterium]